MKSLFFKATLTFILSIFLLSPLVSAKGPHNKPFLPDILDGWTEIDPLAVYPGFEYKGLAPSCADCPSTYSDGVRKEYDSEFTFFVKKGDSKNLVVYFQGGGACWDSLNCLYFHTFYEEVPPIEMFYDTEGRGIFDAENPENMLKDWSFVYIPYCTGDIHWGANDQEYQAIDAYPYSQILAEEGESFTIKHRGFVNFQVVLKWIEDNFRKPSRIFVTGSSAGSYGAIMGFPYIKEAFPRSHVSVLGDAGNGVVSEGFQNESIENWGVQENFPDWIPGFDKSFAELSMPEIYKLIAEHYSHSKIGQYTTAWDWNQTFFYAVMLDIDNYPDTDPINWENPSFWSMYWDDWHDQMLEFAYEAAEAPNYRYYIAPGDTHTIMMSPLFYTEISEGIYFTEWIEAMVGNQGGTRGHGAMPWLNVECNDCPKPLIE